MELNGINNFPPGPENPLAPAIPQEHDGSGQSPADGQTRLFEKIKQSASGAFSKTVEVLKRGRGAPRKDGQPKKSDIVREIPGEPVEVYPDAVPAPAVPVISTSLIKRCLSGILKGLLAVPNAKLAERAVAKGKSETEANKLISQCAPTDEEIDGLSEFAGILLQKYNVDTRFAPEVACAAIAAGIGLRYVAVFQTLNRFPDVQPKENQ